MVCLYFSPSPRLIKVGMLNYKVKYISNQMNLIFTFHRCDSVSFCIILHIVDSGLGSILLMLLINSELFVS